MKPLKSSLHFTPRRKRPAISPNVVPTVDIELDKTRKLRVDFNSLCLMEETADKPFAELGIWNRLRASDIRLAVWAACLHEDPELTQARVGRWLHMGNLQYVITKLTEAFTASSKAAGANSPLAQVLATAVPQPVNA